MYQTGKTFDIKLRLNEINRRSVQLSAASSKLADLVAQLDHLRSVDERIRIFADRRASSDRRRNGDYLSRKHLGNGRARFAFSSGIADEC